MEDVDGVGPWSAGGEAGVVVGMGGGCVWVGMGMTRAPCEGVCVGQQALGGS